MKKREGKKDKVWSKRPPIIVAVVAVIVGVLSSIFIWNCSKQIITVYEMKSKPPLIPTRIFVGSGQYPPEKFRAYGILAFPQRATDATRGRHLMICQAYVAALPHFTELPGISLKAQMVTVWPIENDELATSIDRYTERNQVCESAVDHYGLVLAREAINDAIRAEEYDSGLTRGDPVDFSHLRRGPFLLGWAPGVRKGASDALVLVLDLTRVNEPEHAEAILERWTKEIVINPSVWSNGWDVKTVKLRIRLWADDMGERLFAWFIND
jgi:hypothetical protein